MALASRANPQNRALDLQRTLGGAPLTPECTLHLGPNFGLFGATTTDAAGFASIAITVPDAAVLVGPQVYFQDWPRSRAAR